jgi:hypothetical protein
MEESIVHAARKLPRTPSWPNSLTVVTVGCGRIFAAPFVARKK